MNRTQAIFQEIENKLIKDDYASSLPPYHPAKGRRKKALRGLENGSRAEEPLLGNTGPSNKTALNSKFPKKDLPDSPPEIENPEEKEIDPKRDFPKKEINYPQKEEMPIQEPEPEMGDISEEEFGR